MNVFLCSLPKLNNTRLLTTTKANRILFLVHKRTLLLEGFDVLKRDMLGSIFVVITGSLWGTMGYFVKKLTDAGLTSVQVPFIRLLFGAVALFLITLVFDRKLLRIQLRDIPYFLLTGLIGIGMTAVTYYTTITYAGLGVAAVLMYMAPVFVIVLSAIFFKEKITGKRVVACVTSVTGCALMSGVLGMTAIKPAFFATGIAGAVCYAVYSIASKVLSNKYYSLTIVTYSFIIGTIPVAFMVEYPSMIAIFDQQPKLLLYALCLSTVSCAFPYVLYTYALKRITASKASILSSIEPVVASILGVICFKEVMDISKILGLLFVLASIVIINANFKHRSPLEKM